MIEFKIRQEHEDRFNMYLRSLDNKQFIKQYVTFEDTGKGERDSKGYECINMLGICTGIYYKINEQFYNAMTCMFQDLQTVLGMEIEFRYVPTRAGVYDAEPMLYRTPYCKLV